MKKTTTATITALAVGIALTGCATHAGPTHTASSTAAGVALPASFPSDKVPLIPGQILVANGDAQDGWSVTVEPHAADVNAAEKALETAGFAVLTSKPSAISLASSDYDVSLDSVGTSVTYIVTEQGDRK